VVACGLSAPINQKMKILSSKSLFFSKIVFPIFWFGFLVFFLVTGLLSGSGKKDPMFFVIPLLMMIFGYVFMRKLVWDLVDEVEDHGDYLIVKFKRQTEVIQLKDIINVSVATFQNPPRITLRLRSSGKFGNEIAFSPKSTFSINLFRKNEIAEDLIIRIDRLRNMKND